MAGTNTLTYFALVLVIKMNNSFGHIDTWSLYYIMISNLTFMCVLVYHLQGRLEAYTLEQSFVGLCPVGRHRGITAKMLITYYIKLDFKMPETNTNYFSLAQAINQSNHFGNINT